MSGVHIGSIDSRLSLLYDGGLAVDVEEASAGRFGPDPMDAWTGWETFTRWLRSRKDDSVPPRPFDAGRLGPPVPRPRQVFAIGLNYAEHAVESKMALPEHPVVFTKFSSSLAGAQTTVALTGPRVDWEAELVVVIGAPGRAIAESDAWNHIAGLAVGQDLSDRDVQSRGNPAQFSLGKSFSGFAPVGPVRPVVAGDQPTEPMRIRCVLTSGEGRSQMLQNGRTSDMIFDVPAIVSRLSQTVELLPGDLIFTGTPSGVGLGRTPQMFLSPGDVLDTDIDGLWPIRQTFVA